MISFSRRVLSLELLVIEKTLRKTSCMNNNYKLQIGQQIHKSIEIMDEISKCIYQTSCQFLTVTDDKYSFIQRNKNQNSGQNLQMMRHNSKLINRQYQQHVTLFRTMFAVNRCRQQNDVYIMPDSIIIYQMSRHTQHRTQLNQEKMKQLTSEIKQSKDKLDDYIIQLNSKIGSVINTHINKLAAHHQLILDQKEQEIQNLEQRSQKLKHNQMGQYAQQLQATLASCKHDIERITSVLSIFKSQAEKYRVELEIKEQQLQACKKRQKNLLKQLWVLQENIKDIYSYQFVTQTINQPSVNSVTHRSWRDLSTGRAQNGKNKFGRQLYTEQTNRKKDTRVNTSVDQMQSINSQVNIYDKTNLYQKLNNNHKRYGQFKKFRSHSQLVQNSPTIRSQTKNNYSIYDDLRHSLRKINRIDIDPPKYLEKLDKLIGKQEFELIALNAPKIMKMIEKIVIQQYGQLKQIDQSSIGLLNRLFESANAVKILQIILFTYSVQALREIQQNKQILKQQVYYSQPTFQTPKEQTPTSVKIFAKREIVDSAIRKNFKNNYYKPMSTRNSKSRAK